MIRVSEIFLSIEGEGPLTGQPTLFIRFFGCNFTCSGFGSYGDDKPKFLTYEPAATHKELKKQEFRYGCDSAYSWNPMFKHLAKDYTAEQIAEEAIKLIGDKKIKPVLCFTGGEPMLYQKAMGKIWKHLRGYVGRVLIETNGSIKPKAEFWRSFEPDQIEEEAVGSILWSISPKLSSSGEPWDTAINPDAVNAMHGERYLKFVSDGTNQALEEIERALQEYSGGDKTMYHYFRSATWLMPMGASLCQQQGLQRRVADQCIKHGYNFCARVHVWVFDNEIGT